MPDRVGSAAYKYQHIASTGHTVLARHGFTLIHTPILEYSTVYERTLGASSDVVGKEIYKFLDSSQQWMTMRPEGTAGVARAVISNKLDERLPLKLFYSGPMFRHERPQKGRLRQFEQIGVEMFGVAHPAADVECIEVGLEFLNALPINGNFELNINTLGDAQSRLRYRDSLREYFSEHQKLLSEDSQRRLESNPLRILDSKDECDIQISHGAPSYTEYLSPQSVEHYEFVKCGLDTLGIPYIENKMLVRGLDYYQHTVWEVTCASDQLGRSQATILAGGRYDGLTSALGGTKSLPGVGWGAGIDRLALLLSDNALTFDEQPVPILIIPDRTEVGRVVSPDLYQYALQVARSVRNVCKYGSYIVHSAVADTTQPATFNHPSLNKQLSTILSKSPASRKIVFIGSSEMAAKKIVVRDTLSQKQTTIGMDSIDSHLFH
ncbi:hypothetical protein IW150_000864 [Coemansia sp. RSA 2607]|nr:hypothetical protein IW150_000864 [Coemansia sp. RSA 2607]